MVGTSPTESISENFILGSPVEELLQLSFVIAAFVFSHYPEI